MVNIKMKLIKKVSKNNNYIKTYKIINMNGYLDNVITKNYNIKFDEIYYYGTFQGYKIYLDNKKYPLRKGYFYTGKHLLQAILEAIKERTKLNLNNYYNDNYNSLYKTK